VTSTYATVSSSPFLRALLAMRWSWAVPEENEGRADGSQEWAI
jgi:hypothetical protein